jgi:hypothetical protein
MASSVLLKQRAGRGMRPARFPDLPPAYCSSDSVSCDMLPLCLSIAVLACSSICFEVMFALSLA